MSTVLLVADFESNRQANNSLPLAVAGVVRELIRRRIIRAGAAYVAGQGPAATLNPALESAQAERGGVISLSGEGVGRAGSITS